MVLLELSWVINMKKSLELRMELSSIHRYSYLIVGSLLLLNAIVLLFVSNFNLGLVAQFIVSIAFLSFGIFFPKLVSIRFISIVINCGTLLFLIFCITIFFYGANDTVQYTEDAVIVLGSGIKGEKVSQGLAKRLDAAVEYYQKNPLVPIIVSGGQGEQESITEALAMERYLVEKGVDPDLIIKEERSTSTEENFQYSLEILKQYDLQDSTVVFITNDFHVLRAKMIADSYGINVTHLSADTTWYAIPMIYMRELIAYIKYFLF